MHWILLFLASVCEVCWLYCIRYLNQVDIQSVTSFSFIHEKEGWLFIVAVLGYAGFGIANVLLFSSALKKIPASAAFGIWTGMAIVGNTVVDYSIFDIQFSLNQGIFALILCIGILGLRVMPIKKK
ncbi:MAG: hypothetical protein LC101_04480 [Flavobacteriales bacterium]|nr:hypothetical protein [Flavobacteriales bacterium]